MSFRLLRVKRRADQDPATSLYLPVGDENKRTRTDTTDKEFRLFKIIERGNQKPTKIVKPTERQAETTLPETKVILLSDFKDTSTVAEAILIENETFNQKRELSKLIKNEISDRFDSFTLQDDDMNDGFVYDVYRLDLGRFTAKDLEGKSNCIQIVPYEQEFLTDEEGTESETFDDDDDSNAEDYYANDYPEEESYISENDEDDFIDGELADEFFFDESFDIEDFADELDYNDGFDLDLDDYKCSDYDSFSDEHDDDEECDEEVYCYNYED